MDRGFWATLIGSAAGGVAGFVPGAALGWSVAPVGEGLDGLEWVFVIAAGGAWLGSVAGAFLALRLTNSPGRAATVRWVALLGPPVVGGAAWLSVSLTDADDFGSNVVPYVLFATSVVATAYLARRLGCGKDADAGNRVPRHGR